MKKRYIPYGYKIRDGKLCVNDIEAEAVKEVFRLYSNGRSYEMVAAIMDDSEYPPHGKSGWNKHHIKRMLENKKYIGENGFIAILTNEEFRAARRAYDAKGIQNDPTGSPEDVLWERLTCGECGDRLLRNGSPAAAKGIIQLRCENRECGYGVNIPMTELLNNVLRMINYLIADTRKCPCGRYEQTPESMRLANGISSGIARSDDPGKTVRLILQGAAVRYGGIHEPPRLPLKIQYGDENRLSEMDWNLFGEAVSYISLAYMGTGLKTISGYEIFMESEVDKECQVS